MILTVNKTTGSTNDSNTVHGSNTNDTRNSNSYSNKTVVSNNQSQSSPQLSKEHWNLQGVVYFVGKPCSPNTSSFSVPPCSGPYPNYEITIYAQDGKTVVSKIKTDSNGNFETLLNPGTYVIFTTVSTGISPSSQKSNQFKIEQGKITVLPTLTIDTGLE